MALEPGPPQVALARTPAVGQVEAEQAEPFCRFLGNRRARLESEAGTSARPRGSEAVA
jgi:hypothetical protein